MPRVEDYDEIPNGIEKVSTISSWYLGILIINFVVLIMGVFGLVAFIQINDAITKNGGTLVGPRGLTGSNGQNGIDGVNGTNSLDLDFIPSNLSHIIWVTKNGIDATGTGTAADPYATVNYALSQTNNPSDENRWVIMIGPGIFTESGNVTLRPYTYLVGSGVGSTVLRSTGMINASSLFAGVTAPIGCAHLRFETRTYINSEDVGATMITLHLRSVEFGNTGVSLYFKSRPSGALDMVNAVFIGSLTVSAATVRIYQATSILGTITVEDGCTSTCSASTVNILGTNFVNLVVNRLWNESASSFTVNTYGSTFRTAVTLQSAINPVNLFFNGDASSIPSTLTLVNPSYITATVNPAISRYGSVTLNATGGATVSTTFVTSASMIIFTPIGNPTVGSPAYTITNRIGFDVKSDSANAGIVLSYQISKTVL